MNGFNYLLPAAVISALLAALVVINLAFDEEPDHENTDIPTETVDLLPLELPVENNFADDSDTGSLSGRDENPADRADEPVVTSEPAAVEKRAIELFEPDHSNHSRLADPEPNMAATPPVINESHDPEPSRDETAAMEAVAPDQPVPILSGLDNPTVIGSKKRQTLLVKGKHLSPDSVFVISWGDKSKIFSAKNTPDQWQYISPNKVRLRLTTGIEPQTWRIVAQNAQGQASQALEFTVVKPYSSRLQLKAIEPDPVTGSDQKQTLTLRGQGFSRQSRIELRWDRQKKTFSARLTPQQFDYISSNELRLHITTGTQNRTWSIKIDDPVSGQSVTGSFQVQESVQVQTPSRPASRSSALTTTPLIKNEQWIRQQRSDDYTIQLFGSDDPKAIDRFLQSYPLKGYVARFTTRKNGRNWYSVSYGRFASKALAQAAISTLDPQLVKQKPWIRSFGSIQSALITVSEPSSLSASVSGSAVSLQQLLSRSNLKTKSWIWKQDPTAYTLQVIALRSPEKIIRYAREQDLETQAALFQTISSGQAIYILIYGRYKTQSEAQQAQRDLQQKLKGTAPLIRRFSQIHQKMTMR